MMMHAYPETYLNSAMSAMGDAFDYAINDCGIAGCEFAKMFSASAVCKRMENGEVNYLAGKSGIEIVIESVLEVTGKELNIAQRSEEHTSELQSQR